jgi:hypothetical protein
MKPFLISLITTLFLIGGFTLAQDTIIKNRFGGGVTINPGPNLRASEGAGTTTLTIADNPHQIFQLTASRTVVLPTTGIKKGYVIKLEEITQNR